MALLVSQMETLHSLSFCEVYSGSNKITIKPEQTKVFLTHAASRVLKEAESMLILF